MFGFHPLWVKTITTKRHKALAAWLRAEREAKGLRQSDVARSLRKYQPWVAKLESGQRPVHVVELLVLARIIGFDAVKMVRELRKIGENNSR